MRTALLALTTVFALGCSTFTATDTPENISTEPYLAMNCEKLHLEFEPLHIRMFDLHLSGDTAENTAQTDVSVRTRIGNWQWVHMDHNC